MTAQRKLLLARVLAGFYVLCVITLVLLHAVPSFTDATNHGDASFNLVFMVVLAVYVVVGYQVVVRFPENPIGLMLCAVAPFWILSEVGDTYAETILANGDRLPGATWTFWIGNWTWPPAFGVVGVFLLLLFPDGKLPSPRWRIVLWTGFAGILLTAFTSAVDPDEALPDLTNPVGLDGPVVDFLGVIGIALFLSSFLAATVSIFVRMRGAIGDTRQQIKWLAYPAALLGPCLLIAAGAEALLSSCERNCRSLQLLGAIGWGGCLLIMLIGVPLAMGIAILKYRLYDIDVVINKTIVFGSLAAFITGIYVAIVVGIGTLLGSQDEPNLALSIAATAIVAIAFSPVKERTQRIANRVVYGQRATPYEALSRFTDEVATSYETDKVAPAMATTIVDATGAERAEVWLALDHTLVRAASRPDEDDTPETIALDQDMTVEPITGADVTAPVIHNQELLGALTLTKKRGETPSPVDHKLLEDLASQAGIVLRNSRLTAELRARLDQITRTATEIRESRKRIVATQDRARRQLERDIHDGAQQHLVALAVKLNLAKTMAQRKPEKAGAILAQLKDDAQEALVTLDELARGIYPPVLAERGIARAIESRAQKATFAVTVQDHTSSRYDSHVEAATYFSILEALQNVAKYASATTASVTLTDHDGALAFTVTDDGAGFDPATTDYGTGVQGMADRLAAVGGTIELTSAPGRGTTVTGRIPRRVGSAVA